MNLRLKCYFLAVHVYKKKVHIWFKRDWQNSTVIVFKDLQSHGEMVNTTQRHLIFTLNHKSNLLISHKTI